MQINDLERLIPGLAEARAAEQRNRALAFVGLTHTVAGIELVPMTPRHKLALQLVGNAYAVGRAAEASAVDSFQFLWCQSEAYAKRWDRLAWLSRMDRRRIAKIVKRSDHAELRAMISAYIYSQVHDFPEHDNDESPDYRNSIHWAGIEAAFWINIHGGFTLESYMGTPYLVLQQLMRAYRANHPKRVQNQDGSWAIEHPTFNNGSDRIVGLFHRANSASIAAEILKQTTRLP